MRLTDTVVRNAKPAPKAYRLSDGRGLYLVVPTRGNKWWMFRYRFSGKENSISFRLYPDVSLKYAREQREEARELLARGIDPSQQRKVDKLQKTESSRNTFEALAEAWFNTKKKEWSETHQKKISSILENKLHPWIGKTPISQITAPILLKALQKTETEGKYETAKKAKQIAGQVFRYGVVTGKVEHNFVPDLRGALTTPKTKHMAAIIEPDEIGKLLLNIDNYEGTPVVCCALRLAPLTFLRPGELRHGEWTEIKWEKKLWIISAEKMRKRNEEHIVPLSRQSLEILHYIKRFTGNYRYIFPSPRSKTRPMSDNAVLSALRNMGYAKEQKTGHGFRAMARTLLDEELEFNTDWIEMQLAHAVKDSLGRAYNHTKYLKQRTKMMQEWADYLDDLKEKAKARASG
ncbi:MAG: integrase arm-type DNA-binding domain-containing protein [Hyphomicrobiales bacterium]|nr:integrase arm-type DNA-binding domain-containing protein [Hyphomicrobiales bacterium]